MRVAVTNIAINIPEGLLCTITIPVYRHLVAFQQTQHHSHWSIAYVHLKPFFYQLSMLHIQNPDPCLSSTRSFLTAMNKTLFAKQNNNGSNMWKSPAHLEVNTSQRGMWWRWCRCVKRIIVEHFSGIPSWTLHSYGCVPVAQFLLVIGASLQLLYVQWQPNGNLSKKWLF